MNYKQMEYFGLPEKWEVYLENYKLVAMFVKYRSCQGLSCEVAMFVCNICNICHGCLLLNAALATGSSCDGHVCF